MCWLGDESVVDDLAGDVDYAQAADAAAAIADFQSEFDASQSKANGDLGVVMASWGMS